MNDLAGPERQKLIRETQPQQPKVIQFEFHQRQGFGIGGSWKDEPLWAATVEFKGHTLTLSRFPGEPEWYVDSHFGPNGYPYFCHGEGSRCCAKRAAGPELKAVLDSMAAEWGTREPVPVYGVA